MDPRIIKTEDEYEKAVAALEALMEAKDADSDEKSAQIELLALLIQKFEEESIPTDDVTPVDVVEFIMDQHGLAQKDLAEDFGSAARVSDFLAGRRGLSIPTIVALNRKYRVPMELLIDQTATRKPRGPGARKPKRSKARPSSSHFGSAAVSISHAVPKRKK